MIKISLNTKILFASLKKSFMKNESISYNKRNRMLYPLLQRDCNLHITLNFSSNLFVDYEEHFKLITTTTKILFDSFQNKFFKKLKHILQQMKLNASFEIKKTNNNNSNKK